MHLTPHIPQKRYAPFALRTPQETFEYERDFGFLPFHKPLANFQYSTTGFSVEIHHLWVASLQSSVKKALHVGHRKATHHKPRLAGKLPPEELLRIRRMLTACAAGELMLPWDDSGKTAAELKMGGFEHGALVDDVHHVCAILVEYVGGKEEAGLTSGRAARLSLRLDERAPRHSAHNAIL
jgi:hypothetical protein